MFFALPGTGRSFCVAYAASDQMRGSRCNADPLTALQGAAQTVETVAYDLADQYPSDIIAQLILIAAELDRVLATIKRADRRHSLREN